MSVVQYKCSRRSFVVASAAGAALVAAGPLRAATVPVLYGDGLHDDTFALQRLIDGHEVQVATPRILAKSQSGVVRLLNGKFRLSSALRGNPHVHLHVANCDFKLNDRPREPYPPFAA